MPSRRASIAATEDAVDELALYVGHSAGIVSAVELAREIVMSISSEAKAIHARLADPSANGG
jgi:malonyl CoA-acyl carrier protein transacylase